jgi:hypothetical protein
VPRKEKTGKDCNLNGLHCLEMKGGLEGVKISVSYLRLVKHVNFIIDTA